MTATEKRYEKWANRMTDWLAGRQDTIEEGTVIDLFKGIFDAAAMAWIKLSSVCRSFTRGSQEHDHSNTALAGLARCCRGIGGSLGPILGSRPIADGASFIQAFALFDTAFQFKNQKEAQFKHIKQFRQLRQDAKTCLKGTSTRLKIMVDELSREYKGKNRTNNLQSLKRYEKVTCPIPIARSFADRPL